MSYEVEMIDCRRKTNLGDSLGAKMIKTKLSYLLEDLSVKKLQAALNNFVIRGRKSQIKSLKKDFTGNL